MPKNTLLIAPNFLDKAESLPKEAQKKLLKTLALLSQDHSHPGLRTKKIKSRNAELFECRVDRDVRLIYDNFKGMLRCWYVGRHDDALRFATNRAGKAPEIQVDDVVLHDIGNEQRYVWEYLAFGDAEISFTEVIFDSERASLAEATLIQPRVLALNYFVRVKNVWQLNDDDAATLLGLDGVDQYRDLVGGADPIWSRDIRDRIKYIIQIDSSLDHLFRSDESTVEWLNEKSESLGNISPKDTILGGSIEDILIVKNFVDFLAGR